MAVLVLVGTAVLAIAAVALGRRALVVLVVVGMAVALMRAAHSGVCCGAESPGAIPRTCRAFAPLLLDI